MVTHIQQVLPVLVAVGPHLPQAHLLYQISRSGIQRHGETVLPDPRATASVSSTRRLRASRQRPTARISPLSSATMYVSLGTSRTDIEFNLRARPIAPPSSTLPQRTAISSIAGLPSSSVLLSSH